jgi:hypothetical protein
VEQICIISENINRKFHVFITFGKDLLNGYAFLAQGLEHWSSNPGSEFNSQMDFACNLVRILDYDFMEEFLVDRIGGFCFKFGHSAICIPPFIPPPFRASYAFDV